MKKSILPLMFLFASCATINTTLHDSLKSLQHNEVVTVEYHKKDFKHYKYKIEVPELRIMEMEETPMCISGDLESFIECVHRNKTRKETVVLSKTKGSYKLFVLKRDKS